MREKHFWRVRSGKKENIQTILGVTYKSLKNTPQTGGRALVQQGFFLVFLPLYNYNNCTTSPYFLRCLYNV